MPLLQFKCKKCGKVVEELVKNSQEIVICPTCKCPLDRFYGGEVAGSIGKEAKHCIGNCKTCGGCH